MRIRTKRIVAGIKQKEVPVIRHDLPRAVGGVTGWFNRRKKANERLHALSEGTIEFAGNGFYRGPSIRHWLKHTCGCHFLASESEVARLGEFACVFCGVSNVDDLKRFGSVSAVQELVAIITYENIEFCGSNKLGHADDTYVFYCHVHGERIRCTFSEFVVRSDEICVECFFDALKRRAAEDEA